MRTFRELSTDAAALEESLKRITAQMKSAKARGDLKEVSRLVDLGIADGNKLAELYEETAKA